MSCILAVFPHKNKIRNTHLIYIKFQTSPTCLKELQIKYFYIGTFSKSCLIISWYLFGCSLLFILLFCMCCCWSNSRRRRDVRNCARRRANTWEYERSAARQAPPWLFLLLYEFLSLQIYACDDDFMSPNVILCRVDTSYLNAFISLVILYPFYTLLS